MKYNNYTLNDFLTSPTMSKLLSNTILGLFPQQLLFKIQSQINSCVSIGFSENFSGINTCIRVGIGYALHQEKMLDDFIRELTIFEDLLNNDEDGFMRWFNMSSDVYLKDFFLTHVNETISPLEQLKILSSQLRKSYDIILFDISASLLFSISYEKRIFEEDETALNRIIERLYSFINGCSIQADFSSIVQHLNDIGISEDQLHLDEYFKEIYAQAVGFTELFKENDLNLSFYMDIKDTLWILAFFINMKLYFTKNSKIKLFSKPDDFNSNISYYMELVEKLCDKELNKKNLEENTKYILSQILLIKNKPT